jgi:hypothetical protein
MAFPTARPHRGRAGWPPGQGWRHCGQEHRGGIATIGRCWTVSTRLPRYCEEPTLALPAPRVRADVVGTSAAPGVLGRPGGRGSRSFLSNSHPGNTHCGLRRDAQRKCSGWPADARGSGRFVDRWSHGNRLVGLGCRFGRGLRWDGRCSGLCGCVRGLWRHGLGRNRCRRRAWPGTSTTPNCAPPTARRIDAQVGALAAWATLQQRVSQPAMTAVAFLEALRPLDRGGGASILNSLNAPEIQARSGRSAKRVPANMASSPKRRTVDTATSSQRLTSGSLSRRFFLIPS